MKIDVLTLFPGMFEGVLGESMLKRAIDAGHLSVSLHNIRDYADNKHHQVDDYPFGGGAGMLMMAQPVFDCMAAVERTHERRPLRINFSPKGERLTTALAKTLSEEDALILLCGHYEGVDQRIVDELIDREISLGDFVLTGGEIAAMALIDSVARFIPGVLGCASSAQDESFSHGLLEYPQYTRPSDFRGLKVPEVLLSGNHALISQWQREQALAITKARRPDLLTQTDAEANRK